MYVKTNVMDNKEQNKEQEQKPKVVTVKAPTIETVKQPDTIAIELPPGKVLVQPVDKDGNETGIPFTTNERTANRSYSDKSKFVIKKKAS